MTQTEQYILQSLELHLFSARIMKEHALFLEAAFTPVNANLAKRADSCKGKFEALLMQAVKLSDRVVRPEVLCSGEVFTDFTCAAEEQTQSFTGICIDKRITQLEKQLRSRSCECPCATQVGQIRTLNRDAIVLLNDLIHLKETTLGMVQSCRGFTMNYPLLLRHIIREAKLYRSTLQNLESGRSGSAQSIRQTEQFWNQIMMEHSLFIRGLLDPSEEELIETADSFAKKFKALLNDPSCDSLSKTKELRDFKSADAKGILECKIESVILPLLADHVLREANHYIRLLEAE